ncbi:MAG: monomethylamine:corrinoid methyltransferase [Gammaproteobacteria bacterium]
MLDFLDVYERALKGPLMTENDFDMNVLVPAANEVVNAYGIKYDPKNPLPADDAAADNIYHAAVEFLSRVGVYCKDTNRVIQFTKEEIFGAVKAAPGRCFLGEGKDAGVYDTRKPDDRKWPWFTVGFGWICTSEEMATNQVEALASLPEAKAMKFPKLDYFRGIPIAAGSPMEIYASIRMIRIAREAMRRAGRPGMPIMSLLTTATSAATTLAASAPQFGLRPSDGWLAVILPELKVSFEVLNKVAYLLNWGANIGVTSSSIIGGYCGGPAGAALVTVANILTGLLVHKGDYHLTLPTDFRYSIGTTPGALWALSSAMQASSRNIPVPVNQACYVAAGVNTKMYFYESAAYLLCSVTSGSAGMGTPHPAKGIKVDGNTPLEAQFGIELGKAACKLTRNQASEIVIRLLEKYEPQIPTAPQGDRYQDCYDVVTGKPGDAYIRLYNEAKEDLTGMGILFD